MKNFNIIIFFLMIGILMNLTSCNDFIEENLPNQFDINSYYRNDEEAVKGLYGVYAAVRATVLVLIMYQ